MIIFGQGAIRCHPYVLTEMLAAADEDASRGLAAFDRALFAHVGFTFSNLVRSLVLAVTGSRLAGAPDLGPLTGYARQLTRMSASFALLADVAMLTLGGDLKRREKIAGRFADILSHLYMASAVIKRFEDEGRPAAELPLARWALDDSLALIEERLDGILANFPVKGIGPALRPFVLPFGRRLKGPSDRLGHKVADLLITPSEARDRLTAGVFFDKSEDDPIGLGEVCMEKVVAAEAVEKKIYKALKRPLDQANPEPLVKKALAEGVINESRASSGGRRPDRESDRCGCVRSDPEAGGTAGRLRSRQGTFPWTAPARAPFAFGDGSSSRRPASRTGSDAHRRQATPTPRLPRRPR